MFIPPPININFNDWLEVIMNSSVIVSFIFGVFQFSKTQKAQRENIVEERKGRVLSYFFNKPEVVKNKPEIIAPGSNTKYPDKNKKYELMVKDEKVYEWFNWHENIAAGIFCEPPYYDKKMAADLYKEQYVINWNIMKPYVEHLRGIRNDPQIYVFFQKLAEEWEDQKK